MENLADISFWIEALLHGAICGAICSVSHIFIDKRKEKKNARKISK